MKLAYSQLDKHLASGKLAAAYVLRGDQDLFRERALDEIRKTALGDTADEFNLERFDGEKSSAESLVMAANTLPLLGLTGGSGQHRVLVAGPSRTRWPSIESLRRPKGASDRVLARQPNPRFPIL